MFTTPPRPDEYAPYYAAYVAAVPPGDVLDTLAAQLHDTVHLLAGVPDTAAARGHAPGKWSAKEVLGHVADTERAFAYRALSAARGVPGALPGFGDDAYVARAGFNARALDALLDDLIAVRSATLSLFAGMDPAALARRAVAGGAPMTARAVAWVIAGHERHHVRILRERYALRPPPAPPQAADAVATLFAGAVGRRGAGLLH